MRWPQVTLEDRVPQEHLWPHLKEKRPLPAGLGVARGSCQPCLQLPYPGDHHDPLWGAGPYSTALSRVQTCRSDLFPQDRVHVPQELTWPPFPPQLCGPAQHLVGAFLRPEPAGAPMWQMWARSSHPKSPSPGGRPLCRPSPCPPSREPCTPLPLARASLYTPSWTWGLIPLHCRSWGCEVRCSLVQTPAPRGLGE